jgi:hypothetical protein
MKPLILALLIAAPAWAQTHLEYVPPLWHNTSGNPAADPGNPRAFGALILTWRSQPYLLWSDGNEVRKCQIHGDGSLGACSSSHFDVPPPSDQDYILMSWAVCDDCRFGLAAFNTQGTVLFDMGTGTSPLISQGVRYQDAGTLGGFTWKFSGRQYMVSRVPPGCQGWSVAEITGTAVADLRVVQCVESSTGVPIGVDGGVWMPETDAAGWLYLLDSSLRRVYPYRVTQQGADPHLEAFPWAINAVCLRDCGLSVAWTERRAVSAFSDGMRVWDIGDPTAPVLLSVTSLPITAPGMSAEVRWPYAYVSTMAGVSTGSTHLFDLTDPLHPVEVDPHFWDSTQPWNAYNWMSNKGGTWWGDHLYLARYSVGERFDLHVEAGEPPLFADGFESGDTSAWSEVRR